MSTPEETLREIAQNARAVAEAMEDLDLGATYDVEALETYGKLFANAPEAMGIGGEFYDAASVHFASNSRVAKANSQLINEFPTVFRRITNAFEDAKAAYDRLPPAKLPTGEAEEILAGLSVFSPLGILVGTAALAYRDNLVRKAYDEAIQRALTTFEKELVETARAAQSVSQKIRIPDNNGSGSYWGTNPEPPIELPDESDTSPGTGGDSGSRGGSRGRAGTVFLSDEDLHETYPQIDWSLVNDQGHPISGDAGYDPNHLYLDPRKPETYPDDIGYYLGTDEPLPARPGPGEPGYRGSPTVDGSSQGSSYGGALGGLAAGAAGAGLAGGLSRGLSGAGSHGGFGANGGTGPGGLNGANRPGMPGYGAGGATSGTGNSGYAPGLGGPRSTAPGAGGAGRGYGGTNGIMGQGGSAAGRGDEKKKDRRRYMVPKIPGLDEPNSPPSPRPRPKPARTPEELAPTKAAWQALPWWVRFMNPFKE